MSKNQKKNNKTQQQGYAQFLANQPSPFESQAANTVIPIKVQKPTPKKTTPKQNKPSDAPGQKQQSPATQTQQKTSVIVNPNKPKAVRTPSQIQPVKKKPVQPKYILTNETINVNGHKLHRIEAIRDIPQIGVCAGDKGGFIESNRNLPDKGNCWVFDNAMIYGNARLEDDATLRNKSKMYGDAVMSGNSAAYDTAEIYESAKIFGSVKIYDDARVHKNAMVYGEANVAQGAIISGNAQVYGRARVQGYNTVVQGHAKIHGDAEINSGTYMDCDIAQKPQGGFGSINYGR